LVAQICVMNTFIHPLACKFFFCFVDMVQAMLYWSMVKHQLAPQDRHSVWKYVTCLTFNPMVVGLAIRGSNDNMIALLVCLTLYLVLKKWYFLGGIFYGLSIHFKIYPIIYCLALFFFIDSD
jgi:GPI mannosyltransferase 1 subunit M